MKLPSFHDDYLVRYEVDCEARRIVFFSKDHKNSGVSALVFSAVEGALGNIILNIEQVPTRFVFSQFKTQIAESLRMRGAPQWRERTHA